MIHFPSLDNASLTQGYHFNMPFGLRFQLSTGSSSYDETRRPNNGGKADYTLVNSVTLFFLTRLYYSIAHSRCRRSALEEYPISCVIPPPDSIRIRFLPFACQDIDIKIIRRTLFSLIYLQFLAAIFVVAREIATN